MSATEPKPQSQSPPSGKASSGDASAEASEASETPTNEDDEVAPKSYVGLCIDRSGSMHSLGDELYSGINMFLDEQKKVKGECTVTLIRFSTTAEVLHNNVDLHSVPAATKATFNPSGMTALLDAMGLTMNTVKGNIDAMPEDERPKRVTVMILTDGQENSSQTQTLDGVRRQIAQLEKERDWKFVFIGANQDAIKVGSSFGVDKADCLHFTPSRMHGRETFTAMSGHCSRYRSSGRSGFSKLERAGSLAEWDDSATPIRSTHIFKRRNRLRKVRTASTVDSPAAKVARTTSVRSAELTSGGDKQDNTNTSQDSASSQPADSSTTPADASSAPVLPAAPTSGGDKHDNTNTSQGGSSSKSADSSTTPADASSAPVLPTSSPDVATVGAEKNEDIAGSGDASAPATRTAVSPNSTPTGSTSNTETKTSDENSDKGDDEGTDAPASGGSSLMTMVKSFFGK